MRLNALWWWIDRWRKSTAYTDMSLEEQAAYRNLLDEAQLRGGPLPNNERILAKACGDATAWPHVRTAVMARFTLTPDGWRNATLDEVIRQSHRRIENQRNYRLRRDNKLNNAADNAADNKWDNKPDSPDPDPDLDLDPDPQDQEQSPRKARRPVENRKAVENPKLPVLIRLVHAVLDDRPELATLGQLAELAAETKQRAAHARLAYDALSMATAIDQALAQRIAVVAGSRR